MTQSMHEKVQMQLYDLLDTTKYELSELNQNKALVINGPDSKLIQVLSSVSMASSAFFCPW